MMHWPALSSRCASASLFAILLLGIPRLAFAVTITWTGAVDGSWHTPGNWSLNRVPGAGDDVSIPNLSGTPSVNHTNASTTFLNSLNCSEVFNMSAGTLTIAAASAISNTFTMSGGVLNGNGDLQIAGTFSWTGGLMGGSGKTTIPNGVFWVVNPGGFPTLQRDLQNDGSGHLDNTLTIGSEGRLRVRAGGFLSLTDVTINGDGLVDVQTGGSLSKAGAGTCQMSCDLKNNGTVAVVQGTLFLSGELSNYLDPFLIGGAYELVGTFRYNHDAIGILSASITFDGSAAQFLDVSLKSAIRNMYSISGGSLTLDNGSDVLLEGSLSSSGDVTIRSVTSTLFADVYSLSGGTTFLDGGTLSTGDGVFIGNGTLAGTGTITGPVTNYGTVAPGGSPGTITVTGDYTQEANGSLVMEIGGIVPGVGYDRLAVSGTASLNGNLSVTRINNFVFPDGVNYDILTATTRSGTFITENLPTGIGTACVDVTYTPTLVRVVKVDCPDTLYVRTSAPPGGNGQSWGTAFKDVQAALAATIGAGLREIWVAGGTYRPSVSDRNISFALRSGVELYGGFAGNETDKGQRKPSLLTTTLSGDLLANDGPDFAGNGENSLHVLNGEGADSTAILDGFHIRGGNANLTGAGATGGGLTVFNSGRPTITNCTIAGNSSNGNGGGVAIGTNGSARLMGCTLSGNKAASGGGVAISGTTAAPVLDGCRFLSNRSTASGGAAMIASSVMTVSGCEFTGNQANGATVANGGAVSLSGSGTQLTLTDCSFVENSANVSGTASGVPRGGAFAMTAGTTCRMDRCLFLANSFTAAGGSVRGGAVGIVAAPAEFYECRFLGNSVTSVGDGDGGAVATVTTNAGASFVNCIFSGNSASHDGGAVELNGTAASALRNCSASGNSAGVSAGGFRVSASGPVSLFNSILWGNRVGVVENEAAQITFTASAVPGTLKSNDIQGWTGALGGTFNFSSDPLFTNAAGVDDIAGTRDDFLNLLPTSPCIDSGNNTGVMVEMTTDLGAQPRVTDDSCAPNSGQGPSPPFVDRGAYEFQGSCVTGVADPPVTGPAFRVGFPAPNPSFSATSVTFTLPSSGEARVSVFDISGRLVRRILEERLDAGDHAAVWNAADEDGRRVTGGLYFLRVEAAGVAVTRKVVIR